VRPIQREIHGFPATWKQPENYTKKGRRRMGAGGGVAFPSGRRRPIATDRKIE